MIKSIILFSLGLSLFFHSPTATTILPTDISVEEIACEEESMPMCMIVPIATYQNPQYAPGTTNCCPTTSVVDLRYLSLFGGYSCTPTSQKWIINGAYTVISGNIYSRRFVVQATNSSSNCTSAGTCFNIQLEVTFANGTSQIYQVVNGNACC